ncbi:uncharacterized protein G2W53_008053 [Senna tora]|uniref:Uncharacterized protein n=1 Tax=Senna tora TaxID=362788 RepID=A0A834X765_9FABA|nr:uncharacterized protein G2W53_008053 [Senna tora]
MTKTTPHVVCGNPMPPIFQLKQRWPPPSPLTASSIPLRGGADILAGPIFGFPTVDAGDGGGASRAEGREAELENVARDGVKLSRVEMESRLLLINILLLLSYLSCAHKPSEEEGWPQAGEKEKGKRGF